MVSRISSAVLRHVKGRVGAHYSVVGADQGFRAPSGDQESVRDSVHEVWVPIIRSWALTRDFALHPGTRNRYEIRYTRTQHRPASRQVNGHGRVSAPTGRFLWGFGLRH